MTTNPAIRADVPISLHPDSLLPRQPALDVEATLGQTSYRLAREALGAMYEAYGRLHDTERALHAAAPVTRIAGGKVIGTIRQTPEGPVRQHGAEAEVAEAATVAFDRVARLFDARFATLRQHRDQLAARVDKALVDPAAATPTGVALAGEVRAYLRSLPTEERLPALARAVEAGDLATVAAALAAQTFLSGLDAKTVDVVREMARRRFAAVDEGQLRAVEASMEHLNS